ncbi:class I SAM-dependent methyltransferase [Cerasicoccus frondis]|uniref:class I SAM-dependent methyltransferase n=1 Tax=Cerasicoccus frondis TaxID=490090 RepID=UPI002852B7D1|nr:class I SAM-dependent methyltransferase [Cerasicoccus frondis]
MKRTVKAEILDTLAHDDERARRNRQDLRRINSLLGNARWFARTVFTQLNTGDRILDLGAGEGLLADLLSADDLRVGRYTGVDLAPRPKHLRADFQWLREDLQTVSFDEADVLIGNFILHQFEDDVLKEIGSRIRQSNLRLIAFNETARYAMHRWQLCLIYPLLCDVSRHDGRVSIDAGFRGNELPELLGLGDEWALTVRRTFLGSYRLLAERKQQPS